MCRSCQKEIDDPSLSEKNLVLGSFPRDNFLKFVDPILWDNNTNRDNRPTYELTSAQAQYLHTHATHSNTLLSFRFFSTFRPIRHRIFISGPSPTNYCPIFNCWTTTGLTGFIETQINSAVGQEWTAAPRFLSASAQRPRKRRTAPTVQRPNPLFCPLSASAHSLLLRH